MSENNYLLRNYYNELENAVNMIDIEVQQKHQDQFLQI
jgi:hypothetical protein